jgi:hypothetical protein
MRCSFLDALVTARSVLALGLLTGALSTACGDDDKTGGHGGDHDASTGGKGVAGGSGSGGSVASGGSATGGKGGSGGKAAVTDGGRDELTIAFAAVVGSKPVDCEATYPGLGTGKGTLAPVDFRFYVHDIRFLDEAGSETPAVLVADGKWQTSEVALLDFENNAGTCENGTTEMRKTIVVEKPARTYRGIAFRIGVPEDANHANPVAAPSPLNLTALHWSWNLGYKFARFDFEAVSADGGSPMPMNDGGVREDGGMDMGGGMRGDGGVDMGMDGGGMDMGGRGTVLLHLGSTGCVLGDAGKAGCSNANRPDIHLPAFDADKQAIVLDYARLIAGVDATHDEGGAPGCMSGTDDPECRGIFDALGLDLTTGATKSGQTAFTAVNQ